jgi:hypothetical protein
MELVVHNCHRERLIVQLRGQPLQDRADQQQQQQHPQHHNQPASRELADADPVLGSLTIDPSIVRSGTRTVRAWQFSGSQAKVYISLEWRGY